MKVWWIDTASENSDERLERNELETWQEVAQWVVTDKGLSQEWPENWKLIDDEAGVSYDAEQINEAIS